MEIIASDSTVAKAQHSLTGIAIVIVIHSNSVILFGTPCITSFGSPLRNCGGRGRNP